MFRSLGKKQGGREEAWYIMSESPERAGKKKVEIVENLFYQTRKYNLLINIFSTLGCNHCLKNNRPNILIIKTDSVQSASNTCKNYLLKIYSQHGNFLKAI